MAIAKSIEISMPKTPAIDMAKLAEAVRGARGARTQSVYGEAVGLTQFQVSEIERRAMRRLSGDVRAALEMHLGPLPLVGGGTARPLHGSEVSSSQEVAALMSLLEREPLMFPWNHGVLTLLRTDPGKFRDLITQTLDLLKSSDRDAPAAEKRRAIDALTRALARLDGEDSSKAFLAGEKRRTKRR